MTLLKSEHFSENFAIEGDTIVLSPNVAMIASLIGYSFDTSYDPHEEISNYDTALIDVIEDQKFPLAKAKHEYNWLRSSFRCVKDGGQVIAKIPLKICSHISTFKDVIIESARVYDDFAVVKFVKSKDQKTSLISYNNGSVEIDSSSVPILTENNHQYYSYFKSVSDADALQYISLTAGGTKNCEEQFNNRVEWNPDRVICVSTGADNRNIGKRLNVYTFSEIADKNRAVDCFYVPEDVDFDTFVNTLNSKKFLSFLSSVCYNNYQTFNKHFKKKVFNKKIIEFCNEE